MKEFNSLKDLKNFEGIENLDEFSLNYREYEKSYEVKKHLNKMLETNYKHVFVSGKVDITDLSLNLDAISVICLTSKGNIVEIWNSEWGGIEKA